MGRSCSQLLLSQRADLLAPSAGAAMTGRLTPQTFLVLGSGGWKYDMEVQQGWFLLRLAASLRPQRSP